MNIYSIILGIVLKGFKIMSKLNLESKIKLLLKSNFIIFGIN